ncbi:MAG TPA: hypothetical protein VJ740_15660 [Hyphomicrobiaceae bacterium]|nr:hypothetical protein [Hyphomicrobiaceae bacterium]
MLSMDRINRAQALRALAAMSFVIYALGAIAAVGHRPAKWAAEYDLAFPVAISNIVYGTPLGLVDGNVQAAYRGALQREGVSPESVAKAVALIARGDIPRGEALPTTDGTGVGQLIFTTFAMRLFGPRIDALPYCFLLLMGASVAAFIARFRDERLLAVPVQFAALSLMLIGPLAADQRIADQVPIGGNRYFGVLGVLPTIHLVLELAGSPGHHDDRRPRAHILLLCTQAAMLALVLLVRSASAYLLLPVVGAVAYRVWGNREDLDTRRRIGRQAGCALVAFLASLLLLVACVPSYLKSGRIGGLFWHRAFISFTLHPEWPYGSLRLAYDCTKYIPEGLNRAKEDRNGHCVWWAHALGKGLTTGEVHAGLYGPDYEAALRKAYFEVVWAFPRQSLELYLIYKPLRIAQTLYAAADLQMRKASKRAVLLALLQWVLLAVFAGVASGIAALPVRSAALIIAGLFALALTPALAAWASLWTSVDLILYMYAGLGLAFCLAVQKARQLLRGPAEAQRYRSSP